MAKRGKRAAKAGTRGGKVGPRPKTDRDRQDIRRLVRAAGSREELIRWIQQEPLLEDFDNAQLPALAFMEEQFWKHERSPKARRIFKQRILELRQHKDPAKRIKRRINYPFTREEIIRHYIVEPAWEHRKELGLGGGDKKSIVKRITRKLRKIVDKAPN